MSQSESTFIRLSAPMPSGTRVALDDGGSGIIEVCHLRERGHVECSVSVAPGTTARLQQSDRCRIAAV